MSLTKRTLLLTAISSTTLIKKARSQGPILSTTCFPQAVCPTQPNQSPQIQASDVPSMEIAWERTYAVQITPDVVMSCNARYFLGDDRLRSWHLQQTGHSTVSFEIEDPADKIFNTAIIPLIRHYGELIIQMDDVYIVSNPDQFVDDKGNTWKRIKTS